MIKNRYIAAFTSSALSIAPMIAIILILHFTGLGTITIGDSLNNIWLLLIAAVILICGLALFQIGVSKSLTKVGEYMGASLSKQKKLFVVIIFTFALGLLITCAEPSILVVSKQVTIIDNPTLNAVLLIGAIALGVGIFVSVGVIRILKQKSLKVCYLLFYALTFMLICIIAIGDESKRMMLPFIFDSGGVTTGSATVPFILAMGAGVAAVRGGKNASDDSFGLVGIASVGPIITTAIMMLFLTKIPPYGEIHVGNADVLSSFLGALLPHSDNGTFVNGSLLDVLIALAPIMIIFFIYNALFLKLPRKRIYQLLYGFGITYAGLSLFLCGANGGMTPIGRLVGQNISAQDPIVIIVVAFIIGLVTILCEPAVHVLTKQIVDISAGGIKKFTVVAVLSLGVGTAICLSAVRAIYNFSILYYLIPGYAIALILMFFCPDIYTAMAFDSGGTASGPMSSSFVLPMIIGIVAAREGTDKIYENGFGVVALIALTPIIAIELLGVVETIKNQKRLAIMKSVVYGPEDAQIIHF